VKIRSRALKTIVLRVLLPVAVVGVLVVSCEVWRSTLPDATEVFATLPIPDSDWVIERRGDLDYLGGGVAVDIRARNTKTREIVTIAEGDDFDVKIRPDGPDHVTIDLSNWTVIRPVHSVFGPFHVDFNYQPKDDPDSRAAYQRWMDDEGAPENIKWYCENILSKMDRSNRDRWNRILADDLSFPFSRKKLYCE
jgi:hypothetical protein